MLVIGVICLVAVILAWVTKIDIAYLFAPAIFLISCWTITFGLLGYLNLGMESLVLFIGLALILLLFKSSGFRNLFVKSTYAPSTITFVLLSLISLYKSKDWLLSIWDEFSHWGLFAKSMYEYGALAPATPVELWHATYPPGLSSFQYFVMDFSSGWREGLLFLSMHLIVIAILVSALAGSTYKYPAEILLKLFIALVASSTFLNSFDTIYQDPVLALAFGFSIVVAIKTSHEIGRWSIVLSATTVFVTLIKPVGIYFAMSAILLNIAATVFYTKFQSNRKLLATFAPSLVALTTSVTVWLMWRHYALSFGLSNSGYSDAVPSGFNSMTNQEEVIANFISAFFQVDLRPSYSLPMSALTWTIVCGVFFTIWVFLNGRNNRKRNVLIGLTLAFTTLGYFAVILLSYLTVFVPGEATGLASYDRYLGTWYQGVFFAIVILILSEFNLSKFIASDNDLDTQTETLSARTKFSLFLVAFIGVTTLSSVHNYMLMLGVSSTQGSEVRKPFIPIVEEIKSAEMRDRSKVFIIAQHTVGFEYFVLRYEMAGMKFGQVPWSIGEPYGDSDIWTDSTWDLEKLTNELNGFDYVLLYSTTESFNDEFGSLFELGIVDPNSIYQVIKNEDTVSLSKVS